MRAWKVVGKMLQSKNTIEAYGVFVGQYPESPYVKEAKDRLIQLYYAEAQKLNSIAAFEGFPKSILIVARLTKH